MTAIMTLCILLLLSYVFELSSSKIKVPPVIALLVMGWVVKYFVEIFGVEIPNLNPILPLLGTLGLILVVLEGALELELSKKKVPILTKSFGVALAGILFFGAIAAYAIYYFNGTPLKIALINVIPLSIISSTIAIPSAQNLMGGKKDFVTYESSLSDILGVMLFNFLIINDRLTARFFGDFGLDILIMLAITSVSTLLLSYLLSKIKHHVKFMPIILMVILVYGITKELHFPALIFILLFGMFLANIHKLEKNKYVGRMKLDFEMLNREIHKFKDLTVEATFLIRSLFFLLFGFLIELSELFNSQAFFISLGVVATIYLVRFLLLKLFRIPLSPILYLAPRGLITILLFISIPATMRHEFIDQPLIVQVIIFTVLIMTLGLVSHRDKKDQGQNKPESIDFPTAHPEEAESSIVDLIPEESGALCVTGDEIEGEGGEEEPVEK